MQLWRVGSCLLDFSPRTLVLASIIPSSFISENQCLRIPASSDTWFTIPIIRNRRESLPGRRALALFRIKRIGILSEALFAFIKFMANGCSSSSFRTESRKLLIVYICGLTKIPARDVSTLFDMSRDLSMPDQPSPPKPAPPPQPPSPEPLPPNPPPIPPVGR
jgi:hypothetical protein